MFPLYIGFPIKIDGRREGRKSFPGAAHFKKWRFLTQNTTRICVLSVFLNFTIFHFSSYCGFLSIFWCQNRRFSRWFWCDPNRTEPTRTEPNRPEPNRTQANRPGPPSYFLSLPWQINNFWAKKQKWPNIPRFSGGVSYSEIVVGLKISEPSRIDINDLVWSSAVFFLRIEVWD